MTYRCMHGFLGDEGGAVTVDWVALVSGTLLLGTMVVYAVFNQGVSALVVQVNDALANTALTVAVGSAPNINPAPVMADTPAPPPEDDDED